MSSALLRRREEWVSMRWGGIIMRMRWGGCCCLLFFRLSRSKRLCSSSPSTPKPHDRIQLLYHQLLTIILHLLSWFSSIVASDLKSVWMFFLLFFHTTEIQEVLTKHSLNHLNELQLNRGNPPLNFTSRTSFSLSMMSPFELKVWQGQCTLISKPRLDPNAKQSWKGEQ